MRARWLIGIGIVMVLGCNKGSQQFAPVSGKVTLNGQPLANATVSFQPIAKQGIEAGPGSTAKTNDKGEFTLKVSTGKLGAVVGKHRVIISSLEAKPEEDDSRPRRGGPELDDKVPSRYGPGGKDELTFEVVSGGTDKADFNLTSP